VDHVAFENPDGGKVLVVTNGGGERKLAVKCGEKVLELNLAPDSMATLTWG